MPSYNASLRSTSISSTGTGQLYLCPCFNSGLKIFSSFQQHTLNTCFCLETQRTHDCPHTFASITYANSPYKTNSSSRFSHSLILCCFDIVKNKTLTLRQMIPWKFSFWWLIIIWNYWTRDWIDTKMIRLLNISWNVKDWSFTRSAADQVYVNSDARTSITSDRSAVSAHYDPFRGRKKSWLRIKWMITSSRTSHILEKWNARIISSSDIRIDGKWSTRILIESVEIIALSIISLMHYVSAIHLRSPTLSIMIVFSDTLIDGNDPNVNIIAIPRLPYVYRCFLRHINHVFSSSLTLCNFRAHDLERSR